MKFKPGQKVICIRKYPWTIHKQVEVQLPQYGEVYTVAYCMGAHIYLTELPGSVCLAASQFKLTEEIGNNYIEDFYKLIF